MRTTRAMRRLGGALLAGTRLWAPGGAAEIIGALCTAYSRRRSVRKLAFRFARFPPATVAMAAMAAGLWLEWDERDERDLSVVGERTRPEHQLVTARHELWHEHEGTCDRHGPGMAGAARPTGRQGVLAELLLSDAGPSTAVRQAAARADREDPAEIRAEIFGLYPGSLLKPHLPPPREEQFPEAIERIKTSLGWGR